MAASLTDVAAALGLDPGDAVETTPNVYSWPTGEWADLSGESAETHVLTDYDRTILETVAENQTLVDAAVDIWRAMRGDGLSRAEATRRLVTAALAAEGVTP